MIDWLRRLFSRTDPVEDLVSAYVDADDVAERALIEDRLLAVGADLDEVKAIRATSRMLRGVATVEAPRSYALTADTLAERGYSENEIDRILNPSSVGISSRLARPTVYIPLVIGALAIVGVVALTIGDISDYATERFPGSADAVPGLPGAPGAPGEPGMRGEAGAPGEPGAPIEPGEPASTGSGVPALKGVVEPDQTVVVEKEMAVVEKIIVEKEVVVEVEREVVKEVEVERVVEVEREVVVEREAEIAPTPEATVAAAAMAMEAESVMEPESMMTDAVESPVEKKDTDDELREALEEDPCVIEPTATPTVVGAPSDTASSTSTPTASAVPTCTPTPTPTTTPTVTATPTPSP